MLGLNKGSFYSGEKIIITFRPRFLAHSKIIFFKLIMIIILIYSFGFLVNIMYSIQSSAINFIQLPLVQYSIYFIFLVIFAIILWIVSDLIKWYNKKYFLTNQRIISQNGVFSKKKSSIIYEKIEDITIFQKLSHRLLSAGTIHIYGGHDEMHVVLEDVPNPEYVEDEITKLMSNNWKQNRSHNSNRRTNYYKNKNSHNYNNYEDEANDFNYIDRTTPSKPYAVNAFGDDYDKRYGYDNKSKYYDEENYDDYDEFYRDDLNFSQQNNQPNFNSNYENDSHNFYQYPNDYKHNAEYYDSNLEFKHENSFKDNSKKLSFDNPKFWENDYLKNQESKSYSNKSKQTKESFKESRKKAMDKHSNRFKRN